MYYRGRKRLPLDRPFSDRDGNQYPAEWLRFSTAQQREALSITEQENPNLKKAVVDEPILGEDQLQYQKELLSYTRFVSGVMLQEVNHLVMTVAEVKAEVLHLTLDNIRQFPCSRSRTEDFYTMWQRFGPDAARTIMIPVIWDGTCPRPSEFFNG